MKATKCRVCGVIEWGHICYGVPISKITEEDNSKITAPENKITEVVSAPGKITQCEQCSRYQIEIEELKAEISERKKMNAEYVRKFRAKKKDASPPKDSLAIRVDS